MNTGYKYIEQLLERYWIGETTLQEEHELRSFFMHEALPAHLLKYRDLFVYQAEQQKVLLGEEFDRRIMDIVEPPVVKARRITLVQRLTPMLKAAAMISVMFSLGVILQQSFFGSEQADYDYASYTDTCDDPEVAYKQVSSALLLLSEGLNMTENQLPIDTILKVDVKQHTE